MKPIRDVDDPRLAKAMSHPMRVQIIAELEQGTATPKQLAERLGVRLENLSYHVRTLRDLGLIKLERRRRVGGAIEHHYRAAERLRVTAKAWERMPDISRRSLIGSQLDRLGELVAAAAEENGFARPESHASRRPLLLDEQGFAQASEAVSRMLDELSDIERQARPRIEAGAEEVPATAIGLLFDTPQSAVDRPPAKRRAGRKATA